MTDKEKIHQILSSLWKSGDDSVGKTYYNQALQDVQTAIDLQEEPVSEELNKTISSDIIGKELRSFLFGKKHPAINDLGIIADVARHFANWQKQQMMSKAIDAQCFGFQGAALFSFRLPADNYLVGSEVKVIVVKED